MRVKVKTPFLSPLTNRMLTVGEEFSAPDDQFWIRRVADKDVEKISAKAKAKAKKDEPKKGAK